MPPPPPTAKERKWTGPTGFARTTRGMGHKSEKKSVKHGDLIQDSCPGTTSGHPANPNARVRHSTYDIMTCACPHRTPTQYHMAIQPPPIQRTPASEINAPPKSRQKNRNQRRLLLGQGVGVAGPSRRLAGASAGGIAPSDRENNVTGRSCTHSRSTRHNVLTSRSSTRAQLSIVRWQVASATTAARLCCSTSSPAARQPPQWSQYSRPLGGERTDNEPGP